MDIAIRYLAGHQLTIDGSEVPVYCTYIMTIEELKELLGDQKASDLLASGEVDDGQWKILAGPANRGPQSGS